MKGCFKFLVIFLIFSLNITSKEIFKKSIGSSIIYPCQDATLLFPSSEADINGDGYKDVIVAVDLSCITTWYGLWILYGLPSRYEEEFDICNYQGAYTMIYGGSTGGFLMGFAVGDINGDGFDDIATGPFFPSDTADVFIIYGSPNLPEEINIMNPDPQVRTSRIYKSNKGLILGFGEHISIGDLNCDGYDDLILGENPEDYWGIKAKVYIFYGSPAGIQSEIYLPNPPSNTKIIYGAQPDDYIGIPRIWDVNGDGKKDLVWRFRWDGFSNDREEAGMIYIIYNNPSGFPDEIDLQNLPSSNSTTIYGAKEYDVIGDIILVEDINGDGFFDLLLSSYSGVWSSYPSDHKGEVYIIYGSSNGFPYKIDLLYLTEDINITNIKFTDENVFIGYSISYGKFSPEKGNDLLISGNFYDGGLFGRGRIWILRGPMDALPRELDLSSLPEGFKLSVYSSNLDDTIDGDNWDNFGEVANFGDINNDGLDEMIFVAGIDIIIFYWSLYKF